MKLRWIMIMTWAGLLILLVTRSVWIPRLDADVSTALAMAKEENFYGIWFKDKRIGFVENRMQAAGEGLFSLDQRAHLRLNVLNQTQQIDMHLSAKIDEGQRLKDFTFFFQSPFYSMRTSGTVEGRTVSFVTKMGANAKKETINLPEAPFISTNYRPYLLDPMPQPGQKIKVPSFDPLTLSGQEAIIQYAGKEKLLIKKRIFRLHHFESHFMGVRINFWLDDDGKVIKEESPVGFVFLAEPKFKAHDLQQGQTELLQAVAVPYSGHLPPVDTLTTIDYQLDIPDGARLDLEGGRQHYNAGLLRITREKIPLEAAPVTDTVGCDDAHATEASRYVQADHPEIVAHAEAITADAGDDFEKVKRLSSWVYHHIDKRAVIGLPDALTTFQNRVGDCNEHAALFAALARSSGIPTRIAAGLMLHQNRFYYHAWNEVCISGRWLSLDTTRNQIPADLTHIRLVNGDLAEQVRIGALLGKLQIKIGP